MPDPAPAPDRRAERYAETLAFSIVKLKAVEQIGVTILQNVLAGQIGTIQ